MIVLPFPDPPTAIVHALERIAAREGRNAGTVDLTDADELPKPWEPATCPDRLRREIWTWCEDAATWINHEHAWRPAQMIPACWPQHPHIARELAAITCQRWMAEQASTPEPMEEWHRHTFPMFIDRLASRLGEGKCRDGTHQEWPAQARYAAFIAESATQERQRQFDVDGGSAPGLRTAPPSRRRG